MLQRHSFSLAAPYRFRPNIRIIPPRNPYRTLTSSSAYPAAFGNSPGDGYLIIREEGDENSSRPS